MKVCFYTDGHLGDFLLTIPFLRLLIDKYPDNEYYQCVHGADGTRYADIFLKTVPNLNPSEDRCGDINIPTHFGLEYQHLHLTGEEARKNLDPYFDLFSIQRYYWEYVYPKYGFDVEIPDDIGLDFDLKSILDKESVSAIEKINTSRRKVLFINPKIRSSQTDNEDWLGRVFALSKLHPTYDFYYTNPEPRYKWQDSDTRVSMPLDYSSIMLEEDGDVEVNEENVFYTPSIFGNHPTDILHNAYLSTFCDIIVGKNCGALTAISMHNNNVLDSNKVLITQNNANIHYPDLECFYNRRLYKARNIHTQSSKESFDVVEEILCQ